MNTSIRRLACAALGLLAAQGAHAAETGFYVGGLYGTAEKDDEQARFDNVANSIYQLFEFTPNQHTTSFDTKSKGYGFVGGYRLFENLAVEGGYMSLGTVAHRDRAPGTFLALDGVTQVPADVALNLDSEVGGIALSALGILPVSYRWELYGRAGVIFETHTLKVFITDGFTSPRDELSESAVDFLAGVGASFLLAEVYTLRAEFIRVFDAGTDIELVGGSGQSVGEGDVDLLTLGITVKF